jgi:prolyl 4-hydroxylase
VTVTDQFIGPEIRRWITAQLDSDVPHDAIVQGMQSSGWSAAVARRALDEMLVSRALLTAAAPQAPGAALPEPDLSTGGNAIVIDGHPVQVALTMRNPRVVVFHHLLTDEECEALIEQARPRLARSETIEYATGGNEVNAARTSQGMFFSRGESPLVARIEARIAALVRWPVNRGEGIQILRYGPGAEYRPHFDYFDPAMPGTAAVLRRGGQRVGTLVMYLRAPERGGSTVFPDVALDVAPVRGSGVFFSYDRPHAGTRTLHGGSPVLEGEKWVATKWLREGEFI